MNGTTYSVRVQVSFQAFVFVLTAAFKFTASGTFDANNVFALMWEDQNGRYFFSGWTQGQAGTITLNDVWIPSNYLPFSVQVFSSYPVMLGPKLFNVKTTQYV
jgi:hypothetical protein